MHGAAAMTEEQVYTPEEVASIIRAHPRTVLRMIQRGELEAFTVGNQYRIRQSSLDRFMRGEKPPRTRGE